MSSVLRISEAATIGLHALVLLAVNGERTVSARELAETLGVSHDHLVKVLQRLGRAGLVKSTRGPGGGFRLVCDPNRTTLLHAYEAIEGPLQASGCLLGTPICGGACILGGLIDGLERDVRDYLSGKSLSELAVSVAAGMNRAC